MAASKTSTSKQKNTGKKTSSGRSSSTARRPSSKKPASKGRGSTARRKPHQPRPVRREIGAVICLILALCAFLGFIPLHAVFVDFFRGLLMGLFGLGYYVMAFSLLACAIILAFHRGRPVKKRTICALLFAVLAGALLHVLFCKLTFAGALSTLYSIGQEGKCGGAVSGLIGVALTAAISRVGAAIVLIILLFLTAIAVVRVTLGQSMRALKAGLRRLFVPEQEYEEDDYEEEPEEPKKKPRPVKATRRPAEPIEPEEPEKPAPPKKRKGPAVIDIPLDAEAVGEGEPEPAAAEEPKKEPEPEKPKAPMPMTEENTIPLPQREELERAARKAAGGSAIDIPLDEPIVELIDSPEPEPEKVDSSEVAQAADEVSREVERSMENTAQYRYPPISLLQSAPDQQGDMDQQEIQMNQMRLADAIASFGIEARVVDAVRGPTVTRYEIELDRGVKLNKLTNLADDIALSLGVSGVRIAPIPDKISVVGIEVPNKTVSIVYAHDVIASQTFRSHKSKVAFAVGRDIAGSDVVGNIAKLPHMLIAGTTGSGKSVCMNTLIISLLYKATPDEVRLIMIDPKMIELGVYNGIPHLLIPVVTDPKKAAGALQWAVTEMMKRYRLFSETGARDVASYNAIAAKNPERQKLPNIVIVIDELADLMLVAAKDVEESVCRIAQMARAAGMHLIIATQRPSADVITGIMKANIPSRIAFAVASAMESRIILDSPGAEKLIGHGDMLYSPLGSGKPTRVQGCLISSEEVEAVVRFIKENSAEATYEEDIIREIEQHAADTDKGKKEPDAAGGAGSEDDADELLPAAVDVLLEIGQASASMLQRRLKVGYARAARLIDQMEERGIIGPFEGSKPRQLLITKEQWQATKMGGAAPADLPPTEPFAPDQTEE